MTIPTEPIGSIPRSPELLALLRDFRAGRVSQEQVAAASRTALWETLHEFEATGSPVITDGEQTKPSFATYPLQGLPNIAPDGVLIPFADGHTRQLPRLTAGPFRYGMHASEYVRVARALTGKPLKQAVISASALSLIYPAEGIENYPREAFIDDLVRESVEDIRGCFRAGAHCVQIDFTEGRLAVKLDPSGKLLRDFIGLNNRVLEHFTREERQRIGVHTCPGGDRDSTHSADVDYAEMLPGLLKLEAGNFYVQMASEKNPERAFAVLREHLRPGQRIFVGVIDVLDPEIETPEKVRDRILKAAEYLPPDQLGTTDDCGFSPFEDDTSTGRETAFAKVRARVLGTEMAARILEH